jgi:hypothetical protein
MNDAIGSRYVGGDDLRICRGTGAIGEGYPVSSYIHGKL